jgi:iron-sulfur cluster repair protein YtfE (RIC family)
MQLELALETKEIKSKIKPIAEHYFLIEKEVMEHIVQEDDILKAYLNDKNLSFEFAGVSMYAIVKEHDSVLKMLEKLARLCNNYFCEEKEHVMLKLCYAKLNNFEQDLRRNIYFENNIFFPKVLKTSTAMHKV